MKGRVKVELAEGREARVIPREEAEEIIGAADPAELAREACVAASAEHHGRAELDLETGEVVLGYSEAGDPEPPAEASGRITLWRVSPEEHGAALDAFEALTEGLDGDEPIEDALDAAVADAYVAVMAPERSAEEVLEGARAALDDVYGGDVR